MRRFFRMEEIRKLKSSGLVPPEIESLPAKSSAVRKFDGIDNSAGETITVSEIQTTAISPAAGKQQSAQGDRKSYEPENYRERTKDGVELSLLRISNGIRHEPPVLLTHGTFSNAQVCTRLARYLAENGFDCWILELRGHGQSGVGADHPDFEYFSDFDVPAALDAVRRKTKKGELFWVAHSGGGLALLMHLARHPEVCGQIRGIVTLASQATDAGATLNGKTKIILGALATNILGRAPGKMLRLGPQDEFRKVMNQWFLWNWTGRWNGKDGFDYLEALRQVEVPALCLAGGGDRFIAPYRGCRRLYDALGSLDKRMAFCAKSEGYGEDYSHSRIIASRRAQQEIWPVISEWLIKRA